MVHQLIFLREFLTIIIQLYLSKLNTFLSWTSKYSLCLPVLIPRFKGYQRIDLESTQILLLISILLKYHGMTPHFKQEFQKHLDFCWLFQILVKFFIEKTDLEKSLLFPRYSWWSQFFVMQTCAKYSRHGVTLHPSSCQSNYINARYFSTLFHHSSGITSLHLPLWRFCAVKVLTPPGLVGLLLLTEWSDLSRPSLHHRTILGSLEYKVGMVKC